MLLITTIFKTSRSYVTENTLHFHYKTNVGLFLFNKNICALQCSVFISYARFDPLKPSGLYTISLTFSNSTLCPLSEFMCFVWIWEPTAIISLYSINWLVFI